MTFRRIVLFAAAGAYNLGDEWIVLSEYGFLRARYPDAEIRVATYDPASTLLPSDDPKLAYFRYFPSGMRRYPLANVARFFRNVWEIFRADLVIIGGGGLFYDNEGQNFAKQLLEWTFRTGLAKLFRKKLFFWGVGIDVRNENAAALSGIFSGATVTVRDQKSAETLSGIGISATVLPDPAYLGNEGLPEESSLAPGPRSAMPSGAAESLGQTSVRPQAPKIGLSLRSGYLAGGTESVRAIVRAVRENGFEPVFLNHSFHPENPATDDASYVRQIALEENVASTATLGESLALYDELSGIVAMRLHAGLIAFLKNIPYFVLSYSEKTDAFARLSDAEWVVPAGAFDAETFRETFARFIQAIETDGFFALREKSGKITNEARISFERVFYGLESD
jgi:polysaccharide pyruvyl transferase WcaK-like protein